MVEWNNTKVCHLYPRPHHPILYQCSVVRRVNLVLYPDLCGQRSLVTNALEVRHRAEEQAQVDRCENKLIETDSGGDSGSFAREVDTLEEAVP
jgi:hypothetical protein